MFTDDSSEVESHFTDPEGRKIKILPPSEESKRWQAEHEQRMQQFEAMGWTKEMQQKMQQDMSNHPGYRQFNEHVHALASIPATAMRNLEHAQAGTLSDHQTPNP